MKKSFIIYFTGCLWLLSGCLDRDRVEIILTQEVSLVDIQLDRAIVRGIIVDLGPSSSVEDHGFVWSNSDQSSLIIGDANIQVENLGSRTARGSFQATLRNLNPSTTYFFRSFVTVGGSTNYGEILSFTTLGFDINRKPALKISVISDITRISALAQGEVTRLEGVNILDHGHCWSLTPNPEITDNSSSLGTRNEVGIFRTRLSALTPGTRYYVRAYIESNTGITYSDEEVSFITASN